LSTCSFSARELREIPSSCAGRLDCDNEFSRRIRNRCLYPFGHEVGDERAHDCVVLDGRDDVSVDIPRLGNMAAQAGANRCCP
jgi:hypothetical protein